MDRCSTPTQTVSLGSTKVATQPCGLKIKTATGRCAMDHEIVPTVDHAENTGPVIRISVINAADEETAVAVALDYVGNDNDYDSVENQGGGTYEVVISR